MEFEWDKAKETSNRAKHKLDFSFAALLFADPLAVSVYDRFAGGEHRWHLFGTIAGRLLLAVYNYPDADREDRVRIIGLREATAQERRRYEEGPYN